MPLPALLACPALLVSLAAAPAADQAAAVFGQISDRVGQVQVLERSTGIKSALGSGFLAGPEGLVVTNFHVVSSMVHHPERYRAQLIREGQLPAALELMDLDVVQDLAVLRLPAPVTSFFELGPEVLAHGTRLFSLGNPQDLGMAVVEGTYNGPVRDSLPDRVHFTGAINAGMSGGPTVTAAGVVVGVNVASGGNGLGLLVPVERVRTLVEAVRLRAGPAPDLAARVREQLLENQDRMAKALLASGPPLDDLAGHRVPGRWAPYVRCWAEDEAATRQRMYHRTNMTCSGDEEIYVSETQRTGFFKLYHVFTRTETLNPVRFASLQRSIFRVDDEDPTDSFDAVRAGAEDVTSYRCRTGFVQHGDTRLRTAFCVRAYRDLPGLYDAILHAASVNEPRAALQSRLILSGFSYENAEALARRFLEAISW